MALDPALAAIENEVTASKQHIREDIMSVDDKLRGVEGAFIGDSSYCPLNHTFSDGIYVREIFIPADTMLVGKIHKHDHPNFLMSGKVLVVTENGMEELEGPMSMISPAGTKRVVHAITDTVWITVHLNPTNTQDLALLEKEVIADSYEDYEKFIKTTKKENRLISFFKKLIQ